MAPWRRLVANHIQAPSPSRINIQTHVLIVLLTTTRTLKQNRSLSSSQQQC
ncbi:UNVERIFIED_CONTAM: hypothetical protein FKN15_019725 [Acipenser sinensis]